MTRRKLVIGDAEWHYFVGTWTVKLWSPDGKTWLVPCHEVVCVTSSDYERGKWKRTSDASVTPARVRAHIERITTR